MSSKLLLGIDVYSRRRTDSAAVFFHHLREKHDVADAEFLVDGGGYLTALFRNKLSGQLNYREQNHTEKWFQTVSIRIDCIHSFCRGSQSSARRWLGRFRHYYNHDRANQAVDNRMPVEEGLK
jgi:transposase-like protein